MIFKTTRIEPFGILLEPRSPDVDIRELDRGELRRHFSSERLMVLRGFRTFSDSEDFARFCALWGEISVWPFGKVLELVEHQDPKDHIFDHNYVPMHWDGMYRPQVPELQIFHCVSAPGQHQGGRTTFSHTALALDRVSARVRASWETVTGIYQRKMEFYHSKTVAPIITRHPVDGFPVIRYCEPPMEGDDHFINHPAIEFEGISEGEHSAFHRTLREALYAPENFYGHAWQSGDVVISDNHTLLHGREAFTSGASRHLRRVHVLGAPPLENPHLVFHK